MPKVKSTRVPISGENPKKAPQSGKTARKAQPLSEEIITRSDDESSEGSSSGRSIGSADSPQHETNTKVPNPKAVKRTEPTDPPVPSDTSDEPGSTEEDGSSSSSGSDDEESEEESGNSESESQTGVEEELAPKARSETTIQTTRFRPAPLYEPPRGFTPLPVSSAPSKILDTWSSRNLAGKQIWHITTPADVPITSIKEVVLEEVTKGEPVLTHHGVEYGFVADEDAERTTTRLLVPAEKGYQPVHSGVAQTLHLQQIIRLPRLSGKQADPSRGSDAAASYHTPATKSPRPQPKGLRMRFRPSGFGTEDPGIIGSSEDEDIEMVDQPSSEVRAPSWRELSKRPDKRKIGEVDGAVEVASTPAKKSKKHDKHKSKTSSVNGHSEAHLSGLNDAAGGVDTAVTSKTKAERTAHSEPAPDLETAEEKARRKEEKRRKKRERERLASGKANGTVAVS